jgi:hypothetical protein
MKHTTDRLTNQKAIRAAFWADHPSFEEQARAAGIFSKRQNEHCATVRCAFVDWLDQQARAGRVSERLAFRATL